MKISLMIWLLVTGTTIMVSVNILKTYSTGWWGMNHSGKYLLLARMNNITVKEKVARPWHKDLFHSFNLQPEQYNYSVNFFTAIAVGLVSSTHIFLLLLWYSRWHH